MNVFSLATPILRLLDPETAHGLTLKLLEAGLAPPGAAPDDPVLASEVWGLRFPNPLGLAAGFDKNAQAMAAMLGFGLGFVEVGTVTPRPQPGNPRPRVFRLPEDRAVINRLGFNNEGAAAAERRLQAWRRSADGGQGIVGVNVGKNKDSEDAAADYARAAAALGPLADYLVINVSSPNTPGLRALQGRAELEAIVAAVRAALEPEGGGAPEPGRGKPLLVKIAPDLEPEDLEDIAAVAMSGAFDGLIATNTTIARPKSLSSPLSGETGGLSGAPVFDPSTRVLARLYALTEGRVPLIGVGGVSSGAEAYRKIRAGASLVQLYTALTYRGPGLIAEIKRDLAERLRRDGFAQVSEAVGSGAESESSR